MRFRRLLVAHGLDGQLFEVITAQLREKAITIKTGTLVEATIIASATEKDDDARWAKHQGKRAVHGFKAHAGADADTALVEDVSVTSANKISMTARQALKHAPITPARGLPTAPVAAITFAMPFVQRAAFPGSSPLARGAATNRKRCKSSANGIS